MTTTEIPIILQNILKEAGLAPIEIRAQKALLPLAALQALDRIPAGNGYGFSGPSGSGKTMAIASVLMDRVRHEFKSGRFTADFFWVPWPEAVAYLHANFKDSSRVEQFVNYCVSSGSLYLDDLGAERIKGNYMDDWATSHLDRVVDGRYRDGKPIIYTTNLNLGELIDRYGARLTRRLCDPNPLIEI